MSYMKKLFQSKRFVSLLLVWGMLFVSCLVIFSDFLFGDSLVVFNDAGSDTRQQYLMQYATIVNHLKNGNYSLWDLNNGFGASMFSLNISNIFLIPVYLAGYLFGIGRIPGVIVYLLITQILLAGTVCFLFLDQFSFSGRSKIIASYLYALNGYLLVWGQHYQFGSFVIFLPLLLLFAERAIRRKKFSLGMPLTAAAMVCASVYMSYMAFIMAGCYLLYRMILLDEDRRVRIRQFFMHCASLVLGIGMGAFIFLPMAYYLMTNSSRLDSSVPFLEKLAGFCSLYGSDFYQTAFLRSFSSVAQGLSDYRGYSNFYEAPVLFFSVLFLILAFQYIFTIHRQNAAKKAKVLQYTAIAFFIFCLFTRLGAAAFNAFAYPFARHSFIFMPLFAIISAYTLDQILVRRQLCLPALALSAVYIAAAGFLSFSEVTEKALKANAVLSVLIAVFLCALFFLTAHKKTLPAAAFLKRHSGMLSLLLLACAMLNMTAEGYFCYNRRNVLTRTDPVYWQSLYNPNVTQALEYLHETDPSLYRVEKDYYGGSFCMDGMAQGYRGISAYNSTPNSNLEEFVNLVIPNFPIMARYEYSYRQIGYYTGHSTLFGIKYLLSQQPDLQLDGFTLLKQFGDIYIYQNHNTASLARFYADTADSELLRDAYGTLDLERMLLETLFLDAAGTTDGLIGNPAADNTDTAKAAEYGNTVSKDAVLEEYALEKLPVRMKKIKADGSTDSVTIPLNASDLEGYERIYLEFDITAPKVSDFVVNDGQPMPYHFRVNAGEKKHVQLAIPGSADAITLTRVDGCFEGTVRNIRLLGSRTSCTQDAQSSVFMEDPVNDSSLSGTVTAAQDGYVFLPVPYENGWSAAVDGTQVPILRADIGFMSIPVSAGEHTFTFTYHQPYMQEGIGISILCILIWISVPVKRRLCAKKAAGKQAC